MILQEKIKSLELNDAQRNLMAAGFCPLCERPMRGRFDPIGKAHFMAPEIFETLRELRIELDTGHKQGCKLTGFRLL